MIHHKQADALRVEYLNFLNTLCDTTNLVRLKNTDYLIIFNVGESHDSLLITITDGLNLIWPKELEFDDFQDIRKKIGIEGTYQNYFALLRDAVVQRNGTFKVDINARNEMDLTIYYKISKDATLTGVINMGTPVQFKDDQTMFRQFVKKILFDLQVSKKKELDKSDKDLFDLQDKVKNMELELAALRKLNPTYFVDVPVMGSQKDSQDTKKRKANTNLINPNIKKRKVMGAKFGDDG